MGLPELIIILFLCLIIGVPLFVLVKLLSLGKRSARRSDALSAPTAAPGWLPDPTRRHELRQWDGIRWTSAVSDKGVRAEDPV